MSKRSKILKEFEEKIAPVMGNIEVIFAMDALNEVLTKHLQEAADRDWNRSYEL